MIREVDLVSYLPPFMAGFLELAEALRAEDPEFALAWEAADRALDDGFVLTAGEYGLSRMEEVMGLLPSALSAEERRQRIMAKQLMQPPYTERRLREALDALLGAGEYQLEVQEGGYLVRLRVRQAHAGRRGDIEALLGEWSPANMEVRLEEFESYSPGAGASCGVAVTAGIRYRVDVQ